MAFDADLHSIAESSHGTPATKSQSQGKWSTIAIVCLAALAVVVISVVGLSQASSSAVEQEVSVPVVDAVESKEQLANRLISNVERFSEREIYCRLKYPLDAKFDKDRCESKEIGPGVYECRSYVEAKNGFGGMHRISWSVISLTDGKDWKMVHYRLGENRGLADDRRLVKVAKSRIVELRDAIDITLTESIESTNNASRAILRGRQ